jgi:hypothetical protein
MALGFPTTLRNTMLGDINTAANAGAAAAKLRIYTGPRPATGGAATTLLAELTMSDPAFAAASGGAMSAAAITTDASADATGTAAWFRIVDSNNVVVLDGDVGTGGTDLVLNTTSIVAGSPVAVSSLVITAGNP